MPGVHQSVMRTQRKRLWQLETQSPASRLIFGFPLVALAIPVFLAGCVVGPDFHRSVPTLPARYTETAQPLKTQSSIVEDGKTQTFHSGQDIPGKWWRLFRSAALTRLVETAVQNNPSVEAARQALRNTEELTLAEYSGLLPALSGTFARTRGNFPLAPNGEPNAEWSYGYYDAHLQLSYNFDVWGKTRRTIEQQSAQADYQRAYLEAVLLTLTGNVVATAINEASLRGQLAEQRRLIAFEHGYLETLQHQFTLGGANATDVALQQAQVTQQEALLPQLENQLAQARHAMAAYLGAMPANAHIAIFDLADLTLPADLPVSLPSSLLEQRPDIQQAEANLHAATAGVGIAVANRLPQFTLTADLGSEAAQAGELMSPGNGLATLAMQALQPIFEGGNLLHRQRAAVATMREYAALWQNTTVGAFRDVANVLVQLQNDSRQLTADVATERAAAHALSLADMQYHLGGVSYITVLTSEISYQQAVLALVRARAARLTDTSALFVALGGGWWNRRDRPPTPPALLHSLLPWSRV